MKRPSVKRALVDIVLMGRISMLGFARGGAATNPERGRPAHRRAGHRLWPSGLGHLRVTDAPAADMSHEDHEMMRPYCVGGGCTP